MNFWKLYLNSEQPTHVSVTWSLTMHAEACRVLPYWDLEVSSYRFGDLQGLDQMHDGSSQQQSLPCPVPIVTVSVSYLPCTDNP